MSIVNQNTNPVAPPVVSTLLTTHFLTTGGATARSKERPLLYNETLPNRHGLMEMQGFRKSRSQLHVLLYIPLHLWKVSTIGWQVKFHFFIKLTDNFSVFVGNYCWRETQLTAVVDPLYFILCCCLYSEKCMTWLPKSPAACCLSQEWL